MLHIAPYDPTRLELKAHLGELADTRIVFSSRMDDLSQADAEGLVNKMSELLGGVSRLVGVIEWKEETKE